MFGQKRSMMTLGGFKESFHQLKKSSPKAAVSTDCLDRIKFRKNLPSPTKKKKLLGGLEQKGTLKANRAGNHSRNTTDLKTYKAKENLQIKTNQPYVDHTVLTKLKEQGLISLVNETFNFSQKPDCSQVKSKREFDQLMIHLFQKEILLEGLLTVLEQNKIDVNQLLYTTFEAIQCDNYIPIAEEKSLLEGYFRLEDRIKGRGQKAPEKLKDKLKIDLDQIMVESEDSDDDVRSISK